MILLASAEFQHTAAALRESVSQLRPGRFRIGHFDNGELSIEIETPVAGEHCRILGFIPPPEPWLLSTLLLGHTLRKEGAKWVTCVFPYLAYSFTTSGPLAGFAGLFHNSRIFDFRRRRDGRFNKAPSPYFHRPVRYMVAQWCSKNRSVSASIAPVGLQLWTHPRSQTRETRVVR
jgi:hypothetical protein